MEVMSYKLIFITNYLNPHTISLCDNLYTLFKNDFLALETDTIESYRLIIGWKPVERRYCDKYSNHLHDVLNASVVIFGGLVDKTLSKRIKSGKLTFMQSERPYKIPTDSKSYLRRWIGSYLHFKRYQCDNFYMLALGGYVKEDMYQFNNFRNKVVRFGYFPQLINLDTSKNNEIPVITWCGRMLDWKHPEYALKLYCELAHNNITFKMNIIGSGEMFDDIQQQIKIYDKNISLHESLPFTEMQKTLAASDIVLVTSDRYEGWGAVVNEAMHHRCVVLANKLVGSSVYLIDDGKDGFLYETEYEYLVKGLNIVKEYKNLDRIRNNAASKIDNMWNAEFVAKRLYNFTMQYFENGVVEFYNDGPLSLDR